MWYGGWCLNVSGGSSICHDSAVVKLMSNGDRDEGKPGRVRIEKYERERTRRVDERRREELWRLYFRTLRFMEPNRHVIH